MPDMREVARRLLASIKAQQIVHNPPSILAIVRWRGAEYFGSIQEVVPTYSREIVFLSKTSRALVPGLAEAIRAEESGIVTLVANAALDLEGNYHYLRRAGNHLVKMTPAQTSYMVSAPIAVADQFGTHREGELIDYNQREDESETRH